MNFHYQLQGVLSRDVLSFQRQQVATEELLLRIAKHMLIGTIAT